jgi:hypothetical protein
MKRFGLLLLTMAFFGWNAFAGQVPVEKASHAALLFITAHSTLQKTGETPGFEIANTFIVRDQDVPLYYIFNLSPEGWIAMAADDAVPPVLAYSFEGRYDESTQVPPFTAWMRQYEDQIRYAIREKVTPFPGTLTKWQELTDTGYQIPDEMQSSNPASGVRHPVSRSEVEPLITTRWNQSPWYNEMCPADPAGPGGHCVAGCVPVCMAQVMYYFRWPETGVGSYTYTEPNYGVLSADFGATTYIWDEMTNSITRSNPAIAELIFHLGVSCDLQYGPDGSGMYNHKAAYSLRTFFKYSPQTQYLFRDSTTLNWDSVLMAHLDRKIPMYYAGWSDPNVSGHAFVCDG